MPRFSLKTLFLSTTLIAVGVWLAIKAIVWLNYALAESRPISLYGNFYASLLSMISGAMLGVGCALPFNRSWLGALVGFLIAVIAFALVFVLATLP